MSAADDLARRIRARIPDWTEQSEGPGHTRWTEPPEEGAEEDNEIYVRQVIVDGRERRLRVLPVMEDRRIGPTLIGFDAGVTVRVDLPDLVDLTDMLSAMAALEAIGALPALDQGA